MLSKIADYFNVSLDYLAGRTNIKITTETLQEMLITQSHHKISIEELVHLKDDEKEAIAHLIKVFNQHNVSSASKTPTRK